MSRLVRIALVLAVAVAAAAPAVADEPESTRFHCDGQDPFFLDELKNADGTGYGETWDGSVCDQGVEVYAEATTSRWAAFRPKKRRLTAEQEMLGNIVPVGGAVTFGLVAGAAGLMALVSRRSRKSRVVEAPCPSCATKLPIVLDDPASHGLFCPVCGTGSYADVKGDVVVLRSS